MSHATRTIQYPGDPLQRSVDRGLLYAVFHRPCGMWQLIAGGGEDAETAMDAAVREAVEEGGIVVDSSKWLRLDASASIPRTAFPGAPWPSSIDVVPEYCFAVEVDGDMRLSAEHDRFAWLDHATADRRLTWDSNRVALWELRERLSPESSGT